MSGPGGPTTSVAATVTEPSATSAVGAARRQPSRHRRWEPNARGSPHCASSTRDPTGIVKTGNLAIVSARTSDENRATAVAANPANS